jgi:hypothetical protein
MICIAITAGRAIERPPRGNARIIHLPGLPLLNKPTAAGQSPRSPWGRAAAYFDFSPTAISASSSTNEQTRRDMTGKSTRLSPVASSMYTSRRISIMKERTRASMFQYVEGTMLPLNGRFGTAVNPCSPQTCFKSELSLNGE